MTEIICTGLDGTNPLHVLAALGILRLQTHRNPSTTMAWVEESGWNPVFNQNSLELSALSFYEALALDLSALAETGSVDPSIKRRVADLKANLKKLGDSKKRELQRLNLETRNVMEKAQAKEMVKIAGQEHDQIIKQEKEQLDNAQETLNDCLGEGIAHLGDIIGVPPSLFRRKALSSVSAWLKGSLDGGDLPSMLVAESLSAQGCDACLDEGDRVSPTPFSFGNGSSGQCLLKDFLGCAAVVSEETMRQSLHGKSIGRADVTGLNWDPCDQRNYALQWKDPSKGKEIDPCVHALAFVGMTQLSAAPIPGRLTAVAWSCDDGFRWPLWDAPIGLEAVRSVFSSQEIQSSTIKRAELQQRGIVARFFSQRINPTGKRNFFAPSNPC